VSSNLPEYRPESSQWEGTPACFDGQSREPGPPSREWVISAILLCITFISTSIAGLFIRGGFRLDYPYLLNIIAAVIEHPSRILYGFPFSLPLMSILLAHELGHYIACRHYGMRCTPPFFLPAPVPLTGTFGAFIKIKSAFRNRRALFDIGIAGPLAGFAFTIPTLLIGISVSQLVPKSMMIGHAGFSLGEPLIFRLFGSLLLGYAPAKQDIIINPISMAGWIGLLVTCLNLLPIWQLDGGHIAYAIFGRSKQKKLSVMAAIALILQSFVQLPVIALSHIVFGLVLLVIGTRLRFYHPPTLQDEEELGPGRLVLGLIALLILLLSFTPVPIPFPLV
jgi:membrane-associated protease RseP (regulator of RpoE activity)